MRALSAGSISLRALSLRFFFALGEWAWERGRLPDRDLEPERDLERDTERLPDRDRPLLGCLPPLAGDAERESLERGLKEPSLSE